MKIIKLEIYLEDTITDEEIESIALDCENAVEEIDGVSHSISSVVEIED